MKYLYWFAALAAVEILVILPLWTALCYYAQNQARRSRSKQWAVVYGPGNSRR